MQPQGHHHASQHARPQPTPVQEQINKKITALASSAAQPQAHAKKKHPVQSEPRGQLCWCFFSEPFWSCLANAKSSSSWGFWGTVTVSGQQSWPAGRWEDGILYRRCSGPHHLQVFLVNLAHEDSHPIAPTQWLAAGYQHRNHFSMPSVPALSWTMGLASRAAPC